MARHRAEPAPRVRYGRVALLATSLVTTGVALLGGLGVVPASGPAAAEDAAPRAVAPAPARVEPPAVVEDVVAPAAPDTGADATGDLTGDETGDLTDAAPVVDEALMTLVPPDSGVGRRVVFSEGLQRVWLIDSRERVRRTYVVSGSAYDNLDPGTYQVYSRSEDAVGVDDSGTMKWFVRFTQGDEGGAIGFHTIPVDDGRPVQTKAQLGTPLSHGCIRQKTRDAKAMWRFAPLGTTVVVV
ncbi:L,D-transpeptidase [Nocardioides sp.]|uniref:L,D-transpeptidase n=1 Tax=Nocardioides sp. TaxID=35761 RepID=UPI0035164D61